MKQIKRILFIFCSYPHDLCFAIFILNGQSEEITSPKLRGIAIYISDNIYQHTILFYRALIFIPVDFN